MAFDPGPTYSTRGTRTVLSSRGGKPVDQFGVIDAPVFDKGRTFSNDPSVRIGLAGRSSARNEDPKGFTRRPSDARPGRPVPCGEPHPDRIALSDALRAQIEAQEAKWRMTELPATGQAKRGEARAPYRTSSSRTPDIGKPLGEYIEPKTVVVIGRRGDQTLRFATIREAVVCITGKPATQSGTNAITNAAKGTVRGAYGWTWERVGWARGKKIGK